MNGQNFLVDVYMDGKVAKHGFFQNFFLEAESPEKAEDLFYYDSATSWLG